MSVISAPQDFNTDELFVDLRPVFGHSLFLKCECFNFAGSIKLKAANEMVEAAEREGVLTPGSVILESSSGNLGVALSMIAASKGYGFLCVTDSRCNLVTRQIMEAMGSEVHVIKDPDPARGFLGARLDYVRELCLSHERYVWLNQYANPNSWKAHYYRTAPVIARRFPVLEVLFVGAGTTGTLMGCARYFRARMPSVRIIAVDAVGSVTFGGPAGRRMIPGLGTGVRPELLDESFVDEVVLVEEVDTISTCRRLARRGFLFGGSTGTVISGATRWLAEHGPSGPVAVALAPDLGERYLDTIYQDEWVRDLYGDAALDLGALARPLPERAPATSGTSGALALRERNTAPAPRPRPVPTPCAGLSGGSWENGAWAEQRQQRPRVRGPLPGTRSAAALERPGHRELHLQVRPGRLPFVIGERSGSFVRDLDGNLFADFAAGAGAALLGHGHPGLSAAVAERIRSMPPGCDTLDLAWESFTRAQLAMLPDRMRERMRIRRCGPNAAESVLWVCRTLTGRERAVTLQPDRAWSLDLEQNRAAGDRRTLPAAAVLRLDPNWYGTRGAETERTRRVREQARRLGIPLVVDESSRCRGRSGSWFAFAEFDLDPDAVVVSSRTGGGFTDTQAFVLYDKDFVGAAQLAEWDGPQGDQLDLVIAAEIARIINRDKVMANVRARGQQIEARLAGLHGHPWVSQIRGQGLVWGVGLAVPRNAAASGALVEQVQDQALADGLILDLDPEAPDVLRLAPPLTVSAEVVDVACSILLRAIETVCLRSDVQMGAGVTVIPVATAGRFGATSGPGPLWEGS